MADRYSLNLRLRRDIEHHDLAHHHPPAIAFFAAGVEGHQPIRLGVGRPAHLEATADGGLRRGGQRKTAQDDKQEGEERAKVVMNEDSERAEDGTTPEGRGWSSG